MARKKGSIGWKKQQAYLHEKFPEQGWMEETDKKVIKENYKAVKHTEYLSSLPEESLKQFVDY